MNKEYTESRTHSPPKGFAWSKPTLMTQGYTLR
jgi:hypothetical protein